MALHHERPLAGALRGRALEDDLAKLAGVEEVGAREVLVAPAVAGCRRSGVDDQAHVRERTGLLVERVGAGRLAEHPEHLRVAEMLDEEPDAEVLGIDLVALGLGMGGDAQRAERNDAQDEL